MTSFLDKTKWFIVEEAPLTGSGLHEILFATVTKREAVEVAKTLGYQVTGRNAPYAILRRPRPWQP